MKRSLVPRLAAPLVLAALVLVTAMNAVSASPGPDAGAPTPSITPPFELTPIVVATPRPILRFVAVPDCHHLTQTACGTLLSSRGLWLGTVTLVSPQGPPPYIGSHVIAQNPGTGSLVLRGSSVNITIQPFGPPFRP